MTATEDSEKGKPMQAYYFGVWAAGDAGHFLHRPGGSRCGRREEQCLPFSPHILDSHLLPQVGGWEPEGVVHRATINGWTVLTFWDRSGDMRGRSNSAFVLEGEHTTAAGLALARGLFPTIFQRFPFELTDATQCHPEGG